MQELLIAVLGAGGLIIALRTFDKSNVGRQQKKLELSSRDFAKIEATLRGEQKQEDKETMEKVDEIEQEKNTKQSADSLVDFFRKRK